VKNIIKLSAITIISLGLTACASTSTEPKKLNELTTIEANDSQALKITKLADLDRNIEDLKVPADFDTGGYSMTRGAVDLTTGALGVGLSSASGFAGSLGSFGIGFLMSNKNEPYNKFQLISFVKNDAESDAIRLYQRKQVESLGKIKTSEIVSTGITYKIYYKYDSSVTSCKASTDKYCRTATYFVAKAKVSSSEVSKLDIEQLPANDYTVVRWSIPYDLIESAVVSGIPFENTFLYVPHKNIKATKVSITGYLDKFLTKMPYLINLKEQSALFYLKS
jgi:hypothetical protein